jgi:hypothetical protein
MLVNICCEEGDKIVGAAWLGLINTPDTQLPLIKARRRLLSKRTWLGCLDFSLLFFGAPYSPVVVGGGGELIVAHLSHT